MRRDDVIAWVLSVTASLRLSQSKTLSVLVAAALGTARVSLAELGRHLTGPAAAKHRIKRAWRFTANERIEVATAMRGVVRRLLKRRRKRPLVVAFDWTEVGGFCTLMAAAVMKGRAVPLRVGQYRQGPVEAPPQCPGGEVARVNSGRCSRRACR